MRVRTADKHDLSFLRSTDFHVAEDELEQVVQIRRVLVAEEDGQPVGLVRWGLFWDEVPFLNLIFVLEPHRRRGVGTRLIDAWESQQREAGHAAVLTSTLASEDAQHLYRQLGYVDCGCILLPGEPLEILMRKSLDVAASEAKASV